MARSQPSAARDQVRDIVPGLIDLSERVLFGEVWERPGLSKRDRSLITVATLVALGRKNQLRGYFEQRSATASAKTRSASRSPIWPSARAGPRDDRGARRKGSVRRIGA